MDFFQYLGYKENGRCRSISYAAVRWKHCEAAPASTLFSLKFGFELSRRLDVKSVRFDLIRMSHVWHGCFRLIRVDSGNANAFTIICVTRGDTHTTIRVSGTSDETALGSMRLEL